MPFITDANARQLSALAHVAKRQLKDAKAAMEANGNLDKYQARRLARVREQLDRVDKMLLTETDPQKLDRLACASMRLSDQEFALAGRAKPANAKVQPANRRPAQRPPPRPVVAEAEPDTTTSSVP